MAQGPVQSLLHFCVLSKILFTKNTLPRVSRHLAQTLTPNQEVISYAGTHDVRKGLEAHRSPEVVPQAQGLRIFPIAHQEHLQEDITEPGTLFLIVLD